MFTNKVIKNATKQSVQQSVLARRGLPFLGVKNILMRVLTTRGDTPGMEIMV